MQCDYHETHVTGCDWLRKHVDLVRVRIKVTLKYLKPIVGQNVAIVLRNEACK